MLKTNPKLQHFPLSEQKQYVRVKRIECLIPILGEERLMGARKAFSGAQEYGQVMKVFLSAAFAFF